MALIKWLKAQKVARRIDAPPAAAKPVAWVEPSFEAGSVVLKKGDKLLRVVWHAGTQDRRRVVPAGKHGVYEFRIERTTQRTHWFLASSGPPYQKVEVAAKGRTSLVISDALTCTTQAKRVGQELRFSFGMRAATGHGITVFKNFLRVPVTYRILDKQGKEIAAGKMDYG